MIVAEHKGRLGNQLFQLAGALRLARQGERVLLLGYEDLQRLLEPHPQLRFLNSNRPGLYRLATRAIDWAYRLPSRWRRCAGISIKPGGNRPRLGSCTGLRLESVRRRRPGGRHQDQGVLRIADPALDQGAGQQQPIGGIPHAGLSVRRAKAEAASARPMS